MRTQVVPSVVGVTLYLQQWGRLAGESILGVISKTRLPAPRVGQAAGVKTPTTNVPKDAAVTRIKLITCSFIHRPSPLQLPSPESLKITNKHRAITAVVPMALILDPDKRRATRYKIKKTIPTIISLTFTDMELPKVEAKHTHVGLLFPTRHMLHSLRQIFQSFDRPEPHLPPLRLEAGRRLPASKV